MQIQCKLTAKTTSTGICKFLKLDKESEENKEFMGNLSFQNVKFSLESSCMRMSRLSAK